ncbi:MAG: diadenylate cyclase, partial [Candidatus Hadarchaeales archaeon]
AKAAVSLATLIEADAVVVRVDNVNIPTQEILKELSIFSKKIIICTGSSDEKSFSTSYPVVHVPLKSENTEKEAEFALAVCVRQGVLSKGEKVVYLDGSHAIHLKIVDDVEKIFSFDETVIHAIKLALYIANTSYNNMRVGAAFIIGDWKTVMRLSHQLESDPLPHQARDIKKKDNYPIIAKIAATHDGAFVVDSNGIIRACCRHLDANRKVDVRGLGSRHYAVAAMTRATKSIGVVVSQEDGHVRVFQNGKIVLTIQPSGHVMDSQ